MQYKRIYAARFKRDLRLAAKQGRDLQRLAGIIDRLTAGERLPAEYEDHPLKGEYKGFRECHIAPDWLLVYKIDRGLLVLVLFRVGTHSDLFDE